MKIPTSEKGPHTFLDEFQRTSEHFRYDEQHRSRETYTNSENVPVDELPKPKNQTLSDKKKQDQTQTVKLLTQHATTVAAVAATVTVVLPILPALTPTPEPAPLPEPTFTMEESVVGLDAYECALKAENVEGALTALLTTADGTILESILFPENGQLHFENLHPETEYTLRLQSEQAEELFSYVFTTDPFVQIVETKDSTVSELVLHESLPTSGDCIMTLYDTQGNETSAIGVSFERDETIESGNAETVRYYLFQGGLPEGKYTLQFTCFSPDIAQDSIYEKTITAGTMRAFDFNTTVDLDASLISLQPLTGDLTPYETLYAELWYQGAFVSERNLEHDLNDGTLYLPLDDLTSGTYELRLYGVHAYEGVEFRTSLWTRTDLVVSSLPDPTFAIAQETIGLTTYQCTLTMENVRDPLTALLTTADGTVLQNGALPENGTLNFENLSPETTYTILLRDEQETALYRQYFTTAPFVQITETTDLNVSELVLHKSLPTSGDCRMQLFDTQGNEISAIETSFESSDGTGGGSSDSADSSSGYDETLSVRYYLFQAGIPEGEYTLRFIYYVDGEEHSYEKTITAGTMSFFDFNTTVDPSANTISLQSLMGNLTPYETFYAELWYQGELVFESTSGYALDDGTLQLSFDGLTPGTYELRLYGVHAYEGVEFRPLLWTRTDLVVSSLPDPTFTLAQETVGLTTYQCTLTMENVRSTLTALLTTADGTILQNGSLPENGTLNFENLSPETKYTILLQNELSETLYTHEFTTEAFVQITETTDSNVSELRLHESLPTGGDCRMQLFDTQGNEMYAIETSFESSDGTGGGSSDSADSSSGYDETLSVRYYLFQAGIPEDEYVLRFIYYVDGVENFYEKTITAGTMTPFAFDATVDVNAGTIILQPTTGDLTPYQNQEFYVYMDQGSSSSSCYPTVKDGLLCLTFSSLQSGVAARIYLSVNYVFENVQFSAQIWIGEIQI